MPETIPEEGMPRRARVRVGNIPWHVVQRGHNRQRCFLSSSDCSFYLEQLTALSGVFDCAVHAYVLMTNHIHLLLTPTCERGASLLMKNLGQRVVQRMNRVHQRSGSLWEGRFRSSLIESGRYLFCCYRYIELNPVRAGLVCHPGDYPWSSYRTNAEGKASRLIRPHEDYLRLGDTDIDRTRAYRELFGRTIDEPEFEIIRTRTNGGFAIGSAGFRLRMARTTGQRVEPLRRQRGHGAV
jgi:putative transposase